MTESTRTALIIEGDLDVRSLLDDVFTSAGLRTVLVDTELDAIAAVRQHRPMILVLDADMPELDQVAVVHRVRETSDTHIIWLSSQTAQSDIVLGLSAGADDYVSKPFRPRELRARIDAFLRRRHIDDAHEVATEDEPAARTARNPATEAGLRATGDDSEQWMSHRDLSLNTETRTVLVAQHEVELTSAEFELLATLLKSKRRVRSTSDLVLVLHGKLPGEWYDVEESEKRMIDDTMTALIGRLAESGGEGDYIEVEQGAGYRLTAR